MIKIGNGGFAGPRRVIGLQRSLEAGGRVALLISLFPPAWLVGIDELGAREYHTTTSRSNPSEPMVGFATVK